MTVSGFLDESGKFKDHKVIAIGCVADFAERLQGFTQDWGTLLHRNGLEELTAKRVLNARRPLSERTPALGIESRIEALLPFVSCIRKNLQVITGCAVDVRIFKKLPQHFFQSFGSDPSYMAVMRTMLQIAEFAPPRDRVSLIFDEDEETAWDFYRIYRRVKRVWPQAKRKFSAISFADDRALFGLQAADFVASIIRHEVTRQVTRAKYDYRPLYNALIADPEKHERLMYVGIAIAKKDNLLKTAESLKEEWAKFKKEAHKD
jgi:hypothetical protein